MCATTVTTMRMADTTITIVGPILIPGVSSSKNLMSPAPPLGIGPSPLLRFFLALLGITITSYELSVYALGVLIKPSK